MKWIIDCNVQFEVFEIVIKSILLHAFKNISYNQLKQILCERHLKSCMCQENLLTQEAFENFLQTYLTAAGLEFGYSSYVISKKDYKYFAARYIALSSEFEVPLKKSDIIDNLSEKMENSGGTMNLMTPAQKDIIENLSIENQNLDQGLLMLELSLMSVKIVNLGPCL